jgi:hypothetical protein
MRNCPNSFQPLPNPLLRALRNFDNLNVKSPLLGPLFLRFRPLTGFVNEELSTSQTVPGAGRVPFRKYALMAL